VTTIETLLIDRLNQPAEPVQSKPFSGASEGSQSGSASEHYDARVRSIYDEIDSRFRCAIVGACVATRSDRRPWLYGAFTTNNDPGAYHYFFFSSTSGSPIKDFPFHKSCEVPLAPVVRAGSFWWDASARLLEGFSSFYYTHTPSVRKRTVTWS
jgi:hypothetical protein